MIEDELRTLLTERADEVPDNATRVADVHSRVGGIRRRRTAAATLALALIVAAGVLFTRLPGKPQTLPAGSPAGPYFSDDGRPATVPGYHGDTYFTFTGRDIWSVLGRPFSTVVIARCDRPGDLILTSEPEGGTNPPDLHLSCRVPVGDHFEGALPIDPKQAGGGLWDVVPGAGSWSVGLLAPLYPDSLNPQELAAGLFAGPGHPAGGSFAVTIPGNVPLAHGMVLSVVCVRDVRLEFSVSGRALTTVSCTDDANPGVIGNVTVLVPERTLTALGLRPLQRVTVDVRSTGRQTDQWVVSDVG